MRAAPNLVALAVYLGCGALLHALMVGPQFDWSSAWTWGWLLGWPLALFVTFWAVVLAVFLAFMVVGGVALLVIHLRERWRMRKLRALRVPRRPA